MLVEAVPGSGKTRVIVARCAALVSAGVAPREILLLTFSRRAVGELRARLSAELGTRENCRRFAPSTGSPRDYSRIRVRAATPACSRNLPSARSSSAPSRRRTSRRCRAASCDLRCSAKRQRRGSPNFVARPSNASAALAARATPRLLDVIALEAEQRRLRAQLGVADYDDLVARAVTLAREPGSAVARALAGRYEHVLVDEFQDTDSLQLELLQCLDATIFAVGDAAQAIYGFRGAARDALERARVALAMVSLELAESFRCPENVCALARAIQPGVAHNLER